MKVETGGWAGSLTRGQCDRYETHTKLWSKIFERNGLFGIGTCSERIL